MLAGWIALGSFFVYLAGLFALARYGDRASRFVERPFRRKTVYALSSCIYYSSWCYFGSVGLASHRGLDVLPIYIGPLLIFAVFHPVIVRMIQLAKAQNITSVADFVAARHGKAASVAATVSVIAVVAYIPYIALQLKATAANLTIFFEGQLPNTTGARPGALVVMRGPRRPLRSSSRASCGTRGAPARARSS